MTLPVQPTLAEMKRSVLVRSGLADMADINARYNDLLTELINRAQLKIYLEANWTALRVRTTFASVDDTTDYDIPSATSIGGIIRLAIKDLDDSETDLSYDDTSDIEGYLKTDKTKPTFWRIIDGVIRVLPKVDATAYPTFIMEYMTVPTTLVNDTDRCAIDGEALKQYATILFKRHLGTFKDSLRSDELDLGAYIMLLRGRNAPARMFNLASRQYMGPAYGPGISSVTGYGITPYYWAGWSPW